MNIMVAADVVSLVFLLDLLDLKGGVVDLLNSGDIR